MRVCRINYGQAPALGGSTIAGACFSRREMYSALNKIYQAFMHTVAMCLFIALVGVTFMTPVELAAACGARWARRIVVYFVEGGGR